VRTVRSWLDGRQVIGYVCGHAIAGACSRGVDCAVVQSAFSETVLVNFWSQYLPQTKV